LYFSSKEDVDVMDAARRDISCLKSDSILFSASKMLISHLDLIKEVQRVLTDSLIKGIQKNM